uniref:Uncharacterized protein n=1 Tax=Timema monikensis TaxID=170555 RepID=A0A7R9E4W0_9NEOP|nr:unnamed protein product [Timema monikensis]
MTSQNRNGRFVPEPGLEMGSAAPPFHPLPAASDVDPDFSEPIRNVTVPVGREAVLSCSVTELGHYKTISVVIAPFGYRSRDPGFNPRCFQSLCEELSREWGQLSLVRTNEELRER